MSKKIHPNLKDVAETLLIPLYCRAIESQRPDAIIRDDSAVAIVSQLDCDFSHLCLHGLSEQSTVLRVREFDRLTREFLLRNPQAVVVYIGCGLDTRFERVDNGQVEWFDLDLPEVIALRQDLIGSEKERYHLLSGSVFISDWIEALCIYRQRPFLFLAEGVLPYFEESQVKALVLTLRDQFPGAELVCDALSPFILKVNNLQLAIKKIEARLHWGLKHGSDVESWGKDITLLENWFYFDHPEPRLNAYRWMRYFPIFSKAAGIFQYRLGS